MEGIVNEPAGATVHLKEGLSIDDLISGKGAVFEVNFNNQAEEQDDYEFDSSELYRYSNPSMDLEDEDIYQQGEPFEILAAKMTDLYDGGKIKKRVLRAGYGDDMPKMALVTVDYNAYYEYGDEPFDSTYARRKPQSFRLDNGEVLQGMDIAVQSMKIGEKSQFLVHYDYAYTALGCMPRIPPRATVLYEIEVKNCVDSAAALGFDDLPEDQRADFQVIYNYAHAMVSTANDLFQKGLLKQAVRNYNTAASKVEYSNVKDYQEEEKQLKLLLRIYTNLVVTHAKLSEPRMACRFANKIFSMCNGTYLQIPAKVYLHNARALIQLQNYDEALRRLKQAQRLEPNDPTIAKEMDKLNQKRAESANKEKQMARAMLSMNLCDKSKLNEEFKESVIEYCNMAKDSKETRYNLPGTFMEEEVDFIRQEALKHGLLVKPLEGNVKKYYLAKSQ